MSTPMPKWLAVDWGTTRLRVWLMGADDMPIERLDSDRGMGQLSPEGFEPALLDLVGERLAPGQTPVVICGMAGARQGWAEAPYVAVPCEPPVAGIRPPVSDPRLEVYILPGIKQDRPADVMRGEETQIAGFLAQEPRFDGVLCLPGTHTKWVHVSAREIVSFRTFMTGELFALLSRQSVLRHSLAEDGWDDAVFADAVGDTLSRPAGLASGLFSLRAGSLLNGTEAAATRARLSGLLIGAELSAARPYWLGQEVVILGEDDLARAYAAALGPQGVQPRLMPVDGVTRAGLTAAYRQLSSSA